MDITITELIKFVPSPEAYEPEQARASLSQDGELYAKTQIACGPGGAVILSADGDITGAMGSAGITKDGELRPAALAEPITGVAAPTHTLLCFKTNDGRVFKVPVIEVIEE
jgi:hypothetical protein